MNSTKDYADFISSQSEKNNWEEGIKEAKEQKEKETMKKKTLDWIEKEKGGSATWKEIQNYLVRLSGHVPGGKAQRGRFSSYFSAGGHGKGLMTYPTSKEKRYLVKDGNMWKVVSEEVSLEEGREPPQSQFDPSDTIREMTKEMELMKKWQAYFKSPEGKKNYTDWAEQSEACRKAWIVLRKAIENVERYWDYMDV